MGPLIRSGSAYRLAALLLFATSAVLAQSGSLGGQCVATAISPLVRSEGVAERLGDIQVSCTGVTPGASLASTLTVVLPVSVTNRVNASGITTDAVVSADVGSGLVPLPSVTAQVNGNFVIFGGINITAPASGLFALRVSGIRAATAQLGVAGAPVRAQLIFSGTALPLPQTQVTVGLTQSALFASIYNRGAITCVGSPIPDTISMADLFAAGTFFASSRVSEGFATAFQAKGPGEDSGTRFLLQFSGFPSGTRIFVPDYVAGSSAATPTAGGDLGVPQSAGAWIAGSGTLLLGRVTGADASGAGGTAVTPTGVGAISLSGASEVSLVNGSGSVAFEVLDSHVNASESAQIPVFIGVPFVAAPATARESISFGPLSTVSVASSSAPIPRFANVPPADDCPVVGDCSASYYPKLTVESQPVRYSAIAGGAVVERPPTIYILNSGGGIMPWTARIQYTDGSGWAFLNYTSGVNTASILATVDPKGLAPGTYRASVIIDAGTKAGTASVPVTLTVLPTPAPPSGGGSGSGGSGSGSGGGGTQAPSTAPTVTKIVNAATFEPTPLVAGSLGSAMGTNLSGKTVTVTLDDQPANVLYTSATQINFVVPAALKGRNSAQMVVAVDGAKSAAQTIILSGAWPAIFAKGVVNENGTVNGADAGAAAGSILQIWATGIPDGASVSVKIGAQADLIPLYAGQAPSVAGVQQVNVAVPEGTASGSTPLVVCATVASQPFCSTAYSVVVR